MVIHFRKTIGQPTTWIPNTVYFCKEGDDVSMFVTSEAAMPEPIGISQDVVNQLIAAQLSQIEGSGFNDVVIVNNSRAAIASDSSKIILLDGSEGPVDYTINPSTMNRRTFRIKCIDNTNRCRVIPSSGTIDGMQEKEF